MTPTMQSKVSLPMALAIVLILVAIGALVADRAFRSPAPGALGDADEAAKATRAMTFAPPPEPPK